jgi:endonuclease/exonuclease/phosphatase family metal-dependent hydrolase
MQIAVVTYNLLFGHDPRVFDSLRKLRTLKKTHPHTIIALQEVRKKHIADRLAQKIQSLFPGFSRALFASPHPSVHDLGLMTLSTLKMIDATPILLPKLHRKKISLLALIWDIVPQHGALITRYALGKKVLRITNIHLEVMGGIRHKKKQIQTIVNAWEKQHADYDIICGDFNTIGPLRFMTHRVEKQKQRLHELFGSAFAEVPIKTWTSDVSGVFSPTMPGYKLIHRIFRLLRITFRQKLDWIFVKNGTHITANVRHDLTGSDHFPVQATIDFADH